MNLKSSEPNHFEAKVSIVIPTLGRTESLYRTLKSLSNQSYSYYDVWIIDQNEHPLQNLEKYIDKEKLVHEKLPPVGSHAGRNHAIFKTKSHVCIFVDDDVEVTFDFIEKHIKSLKSTGHSVIAGKVIQPKDLLSEEQMEAMGKLARYSPLTGNVTGNFIGAVSGKVDHFHECNFSAYTEVLKSVGGFDVGFIGNAYYEGVDLALKIKSKGNEIFYEPSISLVHYQDAAGGNRVKSKSIHQYWMMRNHGYLNSKHMRRIGVPVFFSSAIVYTILKSAKNRDLSIFMKGIAGIIAGLKTFF